MSNEVEQEDEISVLESIYNTEEFTFSKDENGLRTGSFNAFIDLPSGFKITFYTTENGVQRQTVHPINHLPPITLNFKLPQTYPSNAKPLYVLTCPWLTVFKAKRLCDKLDKLWNEFQNQVILFTWAGFLKEDAFCYLRIKDNFDITSASMTTRFQQSEAKKRFIRKPYPERGIPFDPRIEVPSLKLPLLQFLLLYDKDRTHMTFLRTYFNCSICFEDVIGSECVKFSPCDHIYCKTCMCGYFTTRIKDAMITSMPCPHDKCSSEALPQQVKDVVGTALFNSYDQLLLKVTLDKMDDITYCPRLQCNAPVMREKEETMARCPNCAFVFCVYCRRTYHGVERCRIKSEEMRKIANEYLAGDDATKALLNKYHGAHQVQHCISEVSSHDWIQNNSKNCPDCDAAIEKSDGCNKMMCGKCQSFFCWLCLKVLDRSNPYGHFRAGPCKDKLFQGLEAEEDDEEFDDDFDEILEFLEVEDLEFEDA